MVKSEILNVYIFIVRKKLHLIPLNKQCKTLKKQLKTLNHRLKYRK